MNKLLILNAEEVKELLPMGACVDCLQEAMLAASTGKVANPPRLITPLIDNTGFFALMPGSSLEPPVYGAKVVSLHPDNPAAGRPAIQGFVTLFDHRTGAPLVIMEGAEVTAIRTAAASGLATRWLAHKDAKTHGILGTGVQAVTHVDAIDAVRDIEEVVIWGRDAGKAQLLAEAEAQRTGKRVHATASIEEAAACDIVSTVTASPDPILKGRFLRPGAHVNLVGAHSPTTREADTDLIQRGRIFVDLMESAKNEAGDLLIPAGEGAFDMEDIRGEIGEVIAGTLEGRTDGREITVYKSLGITAQDLYAAELVMRTALERGIGTTVRL
jgi:ornithine cyclodeaminase